MTCLAFLANTQLASATPPQDEPSLLVESLESDSLPKIPAEPASLDDPGLSPTDPAKDPKALNNAALVGRDALMNWLNLLLVTGLMLMVLAFVSLRKAAKSRR